MANYNDALKLEVSILEAMLQRNRCSHGKAKYFQRSSMALRAMLRADILELLPSTKALKESLVLEKEKSTKRQKKQDDNVEFWDLNTLQREASKQPNDTDQLLDDGTVQSIRSIQDKLQTQLPEILSRIEHASKALFLEVARGFFLPFCTIALGALGRIRVLVMRMGHWVLDDLQEMQQHILTGYNRKTEAIIISDNNLFLSADTMSDLRKQFTEVSGEEGLSPNAKQERMQKLKQSIGINHVGKKKKAAMDGNGDKEPDPTEIDKNDESDDVNATSKPPSGSNTSRRPVTSHVNSFDDDDIGQAVLTSNDLGMPTELQSERVLTTEQHQNNYHTDSETTMGLSETFTTKPKKKKRDEATTPKESMTKKRPSSSKSTADKSQQKKKKKRKKKDFFDELFD